MELKSLGAIEIAQGIQHAAFVGEERLLLSTTSADVWEVLIDGRPAAPRLLVPGKMILKPVAREQGFFRTRSAGGGYTRLIASPEGWWLVAIPHDLVLVEVSLAGETDARLVALTWLLSSPSLHVSADVRWICACGDDWCLIFDTRGWTRLDLECVTPGGWYPGTSRLLCLDGEDRLRWLSLKLPLENCQLGPVLGVVEAPVPQREPTSLCLNAAGDQAVVSFELDHLVWYQLDPFQEIERLVSEDGEVYELERPLNSPWLAVTSERGVRLWNFEARRPLLQLGPAHSEVCFSPSGRRFVLLERSAEGPLQRSASLWEIAGSD